MTGPRFIDHPSGMRLAAGVTWRNAARGARALLPGPSADLSLLPGAPGWALRVGDRLASLDAGQPGEGAGSLLVALARVLAGGPRPAGPGTWLLAAELPGEDGHWLGQVALEEGSGGGPAAIQPVPAPEELPADRSAFLSAIADIAAVTALAGVAVATAGGKARGPLLKAVKANVAEGHGTADDRAAPPVLAVEPLADPGPEFVRRKGVPRRVLAVGAGALAASLAAALVLPPVMERMLREPVAPPPAMVAAEPEPGAFAAACTSALAAWWPRIAGWAASERGCALADSLPPSGAPTPGDLAGVPRGAAPALPFVAWMRLEPVAGANPVLAGHAAKQVLAGWPHGVKRRALC